MVQATLIIPDGRDRRVHWPRYFSPADMQQRACRAFDMKVGTYKATFSCEGRVLEEDSVPFYTAARHSKAVVLISFEEKEPTGEQGGVDDDDVSSGCTTPEDIAAEVDRLNMFSE